MSSGSKKSERILGIDPGFGRIGFGVVEKRSGALKAICYGCIETDAKKSFVERLEEMHKELQYLIKKYRPRAAAVEDLFFYKNVKTAIKVSQARGVILLTLKQAGVKIVEITPLQLKQAMTGYGRAEKRQVQKMVQIELGIKKKIRPDDAADALALAIVGDSFLKVRI